MSDAIINGAAPAIIRQTIKPSYLVIRRISATGGKEISRRLLDEQPTEMGLVSKAEVVTSIEDLKDFQSAAATAAKCRRIIDDVCGRLAIGLLCPLDKAAELDAAAKKVHAMVAEANKTLKTCKLSSSVVRAEVITDDSENAKAIQQDLSNLAATLGAAIKAADPKQIRESLKLMKGLEDVVPSIQSPKILKAVDAAKAFAKKLAKAGEDKAEAIEAIKKEIDLSPIDEFRFAFIELEGDGPVEPLHVAGAGLAEGILAELDAMTEAEVDVAEQELEVA